MTEHGVLDFVGVNVYASKSKKRKEENKMAASLTANWWQYSRWLYATGRNLRTMLLDPPNISGNPNEATLQSYVDAIVRFNSFFYDELTHAMGTITIDINGNLTGDAVTVGALTVTEGVEWATGVDADASALDLATALSASAEVYVSVVDNVVTVWAIAGGIAGNALALSTTDADGGMSLSGAGFLTGGADVPGGSRPWLSYWYDKKNASTGLLAWSSWPVSNLLEFEKVIARDVKKIPITDLEAAEASALFTATGNVRLGTGDIFGQVSGNE
jgi:hypothetical protein